MTHMVRQWLPRAEIENPFRIERNGFFQKSITFNLLFEPCMIFNSKKYFFDCSSTICGYFYVQVVATGPLNNLFAIC